MTQSGEYRLSIDATGLDGLGIDADPATVARWEALADPNTLGHEPGPDKVHMLRVDAVAPTFTSASVERDPSIPAPSESLDPPISPQDNWYHTGNAAVAKGAVGELLANPTDFISGVASVQGVVFGGAGEEDRVVGLSLDMSTGDFSGPLGEILRGEKNT